MLKQLEEFHRRLDEIMLKAFGKRIVLYGYGRSGQFIRWYAEYYHSLQVDYIITEDWSSAVPYEYPLFRNTLLDFDYKDVKDAIVWLAVPNSKNALSFLEERGYVKGETYFDFCEAVYGKDVYAQEGDNKDIFLQTKTGYRDVQFMEWLEYQYGCNLVTQVGSENFTGDKINNFHYCMCGQKELFYILDKCHVDVRSGAILDIGCGKGGAIVSFLDYGFDKVGGVEYEEKLFEVLQDNMEKLGMEQKVAMINGDAGALTKELDVYDYFYFFDPFSDFIYERVVEHIRESIERKKRKICMIVINPHAHRIVQKAGLVLTNQFCIDTRQKVVSIYTNEM